MTFRRRYNSFLGAAAVFFLRFFGKRHGRVTSDELKHADFKTSTQGMGIRFTERVREVFRFKWLKKS